MYVDSPYAPYPPQPLFPLGRLSATRRARAAIMRYGLLPGDLLERHATGDFGNALDEFDLLENWRALRSGSRRIVSRYRLGDVTVWIMTSAARTTTHILLPDEA